MSKLKVIGAITPQEILDNLDKIIPQVVFDAVNELLAEKYRGSQISIKQKEIITRIQRLDKKLTDKVIFDNKYMDFEKVYRESGWVVGYDKPAYSESYDAYFTFKAKGK